MSDLRPTLRRTAATHVQRLTPEQREALLIRNWMSHDARWYMAVAGEHGLAAANRLNRAAARAVGRVEAPRVLDALGLAPVTSLDDYLLAQEVLIGLLGPDLLAYRVEKDGPSALRLEVDRCFAYDNVARAGIAGDYECGILERVGGWLDALGLDHRIAPSPTRCLKAQGRDCAYTIALPGLRCGAAR